MLYPSIKPFVNANEVVAYALVASWAEPIGLAKDAIIKTTIESSKTGVITVPILSTNLLGLIANHNVNPIKNAKKIAWAIVVFSGATKLDNPNS